jgi:hypothetical protein
MLKKRILERFFMRIVRIKKWVEQDSGDGITEGETTVKLISELQIMK